MKRITAVFLIILMFALPTAVFGENSEEVENILTVADASNDKTPVFGAEDTANLRAAFGLSKGVNGRFFFSLSNENLVRSVAGNSVICFEFNNDSCTVFSSCRKTAPKTDTSEFLQRSVTANGKTTNYYLQISYGYSDEPEEVSSVAEEVISDVSSEEEVSASAPFPILPAVLCGLAVIICLGAFIYVKTEKKEKENDNGKDIR